jgi:hypothetical protein
MIPNTIVATLATRLCKKCSASSRETCPERSGGSAPLAEKGAWGKGRQPLSPPQRTVAPERDQRFALGLDSGLHSRVYTGLVRRAHYESDASDRIGGKGYWSQY